MLKINMMPYSLHLAFDRKFQPNFTLWNMFRRFWRSVSNYGERPFMAVEEHRQNQVLNHGFIYAAGLYVVTYLVALSYFYFLLRMDFPRYWPYFWPFTATCLVPAAATLGLFFLRGRPGFSTAATIATYAIAVLHNFTMLLFLGLSGGFQFFLAALIPAAYLAHPHRRLVYIPLYLVTFGALFCGVFWSLTRAPLFPIPEPFLSITFYALLGTSSSFFLACFAYVAYKYDWVKRVMVYWEALSVYGLKWTDSDDERTHHIITNQTMVINMLLGPLIMIVALGFSTVMIWSGVKDWWLHFLTFAAGALGAFIFWFICFLCAARYWRAGFIFLYFFVDFVLISYLVFLTGTVFSIHYFYFALIPLPIFFFPGRRRLITAELFAIGGVVFSLIYAPKVTPFLNIPEWLKEPVSKIAIAVLVLSLSVGFIYTWWQRRITQKLFLIWERLSELGLPAALPSLERKTEIIRNRAAIFVYAYFFVLYPAAIVIMAVVGAQRGEENIPSFALKYAASAIFMLPVAAISIIVRAVKPELLLGKSWGNRWAVCIIVVASSVANTYNSISMQEETGFHIFLLAAFVGYLYSTPKVRIDSPLLLSFSVSTFCIIFIFWWHANFYPLTPLFVWAIKPLKYFIYASFGGMVIFFIFYLNLESTRSEGALQLAHQKSESLLLNILPRDVADELKDKGHSAPVRIESVTVMFTDFAGFTKISESLSPEQVVDELDKCFSYFDQIMEKYNLEKLKTIGDSYMCAGGIPKPNRTHALDCCLAAMEIQAFMNQMKDIKAMQNLPYWELRLGIHTGPLVAGVVGHKKFAYDVWGDTVNTASRMESSGTTGRINISRETYEQVKFLFDCEHRGQVAAKNKGMIDMFYLSGLKHRFSAGGEGRGRVPNSRFKEVYAALARGAKLVKLPGEA